MKVYSHLNRRIWYDPHLRMWTMQLVDADENQVGDVDYGPKSIAFSFLHEGQITSNKGQA